jgi:hypothetical protein
MPNFFGSAKWIDADGDTAVQEYQMIAADDAAALAAFLDMLQTQDVLTEAALVSATITSVIDVTNVALTLKDNPAANSDVEIGGRFVFRTSTSPRFYKEINVPAFKKNTYVVDKIINAANADVLAFIADVVGGGFSTNHYEDLTAYLKGYETFNGKP